MTKVMKTILSFFIITVAALSTAVAAVSLPQTVKVSSIGKLTPVVNGYHFPYKYFVGGVLDGQSAYCIEFTKQYPMNTTMTNPSLKDAGLTYILANGFKGTKADYSSKAKMDEYYVTQLAIYVYLGQATPNSSKSTLYKRANDLAAAARKAQTDGALTLSLSQSSQTMSLTSDGKYYESGLITVSANKSVNVSLAVSAGVDAVIFNENGQGVSSVKSGSKVKVRVPADKVKAGTSMTLSLVGKAANNKEVAHAYKPSSTSIQQMITLGSVPESANATITVKATKPNDKTKVKISKQDITTKTELPGATLVIKDEAGSQKATWVSTSTPKYIEGLLPGNYTLCETAAPKGYDLYTECIKFTLKADGTVPTVIMYNTPSKTPTKVVVYKRDYDSKETLAGAELQIKDANGNVKATFTSTAGSKTIENLPVGNYTLCETKAPAGYDLAASCISFTVKSNETTSVVMYNKKTPEKVTTRVRISKQDITTKTELPGASLVIKDANGKEIASWVSTDKAKIIEGLQAGKYTLCETQAPDGYVLATECVEFEVKADGTLTTAVMYNSRIPEEEKVKPRIKISKQDIATKTELPGATLVIKDANGDIIETWESTDTPVEFELDAGKYTLCETIAPVGYILSTECIEFEVKDGTVVETVVMYNAKELDVPITDANISFFIMALAFIAGGFGLFQVYKTVNAK